MNYSLKGLLGRKKLEINVYFISMLFAALYMVLYNSSASAAYDTQSVESKTLKLVSSIKPLQWMVNDIVDDTNVEVDVLLDDDQNHHLNTLKSSQIRKLASADVVFFIHSDFEPILVKASEIGRANYIPLGELANLRLLSVRESGSMPHVVDDQSNAVDWHIWLAPENAILMMKKIAYVLSEANPAEKSTYIANFLKAKQQIMNLVKTTAQQLKPVLNKPFIVLHDGYQYFEEQYGLQARATILNHHDQINAIRLTEINQLIEDQSITALLKEEQYSSYAIKQLDKNLNIIELDSLGQGKASQLTSYVEFMEVFSNELVFGLRDD